MKGKRRLLGIQETGTHSKCKGCCGRRHRGKCEDINWMIRREAWEKQRNKRTKRKNREKDKSGTVQELEGGA